MGRLSRQSGRCRAHHPARDPAMPIPAKTRPCRLGRPRPVDPGRPGRRARQARGAGDRRRGRDPGQRPRQFMALAGGKAAKLVVIPTASEAADRKEEEEGYLQPWRKYSAGVARACCTPARARRPTTRAFARPIAEATAVWFSGGDQVKLVAPYRGTAVEREMQGAAQTRRRHRRDVGRRGGDVGRDDRGGHTPRPTSAAASGSSRTRSSTSTSCGGAGSTACWACSPSGPT